MYPSPAVQAANTEVFITRELHTARSGRTGGRQAWSWRWSCRSRRSPTESRQRPGPRRAPM